MKKVLFFVLLAAGITCRNPAAGQDFTGIFSSLDREQYPKLQAVFGNDSVALYPGSDRSYRITRMDSAGFRRFLDEAWDNGLSSYHVDTSSAYYPASAIATLTFNREKHIVFGGNSILLSSKFLENTIDETTTYEYDRKNTLTVEKNHAFFIYDPHDCVEQVPLLVSALREIVQNNPHRRFALLNEGYFDFQGRDIPLEPMLSCLADSLPLDYQVRKLVNNSLIDAVMAYRILYDRKIRAIAIDDPAMIREEVEHYIRVTYKASSWVPSSFDVQESIETKLEGAHLLRTARKVDSLLNSARSRFTYSLSEQIARKKAYQSVIDLLAGIQNPSFGEEVGMLKQQLSIVINGIYYLRRDSTMSYWLNDFLTANPDVSPIVFIGKVHAHDLILNMPKNTGYSVYAVKDMNCILRPDFSPLLEVQNGHRADYLKRLGDRGHLKMPVAPLEGEFPIYRKFLNDLKHIRTPESASDIRDACQANRFLRDAEIKIINNRGDFPNLEIQPQILEQAYGEITVNEYGRRSVVLLDEGAAAQYSIHDEASLNFLRDVNLENYYGLGSRGVSNYVDAGTNTKFFYASLKGADGKTVYYLFRQPSRELINELNFVDRGSHVFILPNH